LRCESLLLAPTGGSRQRRTMSATEGKPDSRRATPEPPQLTPTRHWRPVFALMHNTPLLDDVVGYAPSAGLVMRRRQFIALLGGTAVAWPLTARAQQGDRVRRIGVLMSLDENDPEGKRRYSAFTQALADLGWTDGRNVRMDLRWGAGESNRIQALAPELVGLQPDIIVTNGTPPTVAVQRETRTPSSAPYRSDGDADIGRGSREAGTLLQRDRPAFDRP
jgi:hypothetical protein